MSWGDVEDHPRPLVARTIPPRVTGRTPFPAVRMAGGRRATVTLTLNPAARRPRCADCPGIPTTLGTRASRLPQGESRQWPGRATSAMATRWSAMPGSIGAAVLVDRGRRDLQLDLAPGTARLPGGSDWANTVPGATACAAGGTVRSPRSGRPLGRWPRPASSSSPTTFGTVTVAPAAHRGLRVRAGPRRRGPAGASTVRGDDHPMVTPTATTAAAASAGSAHDFADESAGRVVIRRRTTRTAALVRPS